MQSPCLPAMPRWSTAGCRAASPSRTLMRLFLMALPVPLNEASAVLGAATPERCEAIGLLERDCETVTATCRFVPTRGVVAVVDSEHEFSADLKPDHVMGITPSTSMLADLTPRKPVGATLDLCCGSGLQALHGGEALRTRRGERRQPASPAVRRDRRSPQRPRQPGDPPRRSLRSDRGGAVRPGGREPALRHLSRRVVRLPRLGARRG